MDFSLSEEQQAIAELASQIFGDRASHERQLEVERAGGPRFDRSLWEAVAEAGLLGIAISEEHGGAGLGFLEVAAILEQVGRHTAPIPLYESVVLGALPIAEHGSPAQRAEWLPRLARGEAIATAALVADAPVRAAADGAGFRLDGAALCVPAAELAQLVLVAAEGDRGAGLFLVDPASSGVALEALRTTSGMPESRLELDGAEAVALGEGGAGARQTDWLALRATAGLCMMSLGVCEAALALTSEYIKTRKQFDQPIAMFQAVGHRAADAFIDTEAIRLTAWQAAWRVSAGLDAAKQVAVAKFWSAEGAKRVVHAATHLHGGVGVDREYPLHRYFLTARQLELTLGGATPQLLALGRLIAAEVA